MSRDTKAKDERPADVHTSADPVIRDYVAQLRKKTESYSMPLAQTRAAVDSALGQVRLTDALYKMRRDDDIL